MVFVNVIVSGAPTLQDRMQLRSVFGRLGIERKLQEGRPAASATPQQVRQGNIFSTQVKVYKNSRTRDNEELKDRVYAAGGGHASPGCSLR